MDKSNRHSKIIGELGEMLVSNWLSRSGFAVARVDQVGLDIVAYDPKTRKRLGITVKARARKRGTESSAVFIFKKPAKQKGELLKACKKFGCNKAWLAIYVETLEDKREADLYLTSLENFEKRYKKRGRKICAWYMDNEVRKKYENDPKIKHIHINFDTEGWFKA